VATVLVNAAQSRKSQTTAIVHELGLVLDRSAHAREREEMTKELPEGTDPEEVLNESLPSSVLEGFTPEAGWSKLSGCVVFTDVVGLWC